MNVYCLSVSNTNSIYYNLSKSSGINLLAGKSGFIGQNTDLEESEIALQFLKEIMEYLLEPNDGIIHILGTKVNIELKKK